MPALTGSTSPFMKSIFTRREMEPLMLDIDRTSQEEKALVPQIIIEPPTPSEERESFQYLRGRLPVYPEWDDGEYEEYSTTQTKRSCWAPLFSTRALRISIVLAVVSGLALTHLVLSTRVHSSEAE